MRLIIVDYSEVYFVLLNDMPVPTKRGGKFVIMAKDDERFVVFSPRELSAYHANIIERFLWQQGVRGRYNEKGDQFYFTSTDWEVEGGAHWELDEEGGTLWLSGYSQSYGGVDLRQLINELRNTSAFQAMRLCLAPPETGMSGSLG